MKQITRIEMAGDTDLFAVITGDQLIINKLADDDYVIVLNGEVIDEYHSQQDAEEDIIKYAIDDDMIIQGWGTHSGGKYWQLPEAIQEEIIKIATS